MTKLIKTLKAKMKFTSFQTNKSPLLQYLQKEASLSTIPQYKEDNMLHMAVHKTYFF